MWLISTYKAESSYSVLHTRHGFRRGPFIRLMLKPVFYEVDHRFTFGASLRADSTSQQFSTKHRQKYLLTKSFFSETHLESKVILLLLSFSSDGHVMLLCVDILGVVGSLRKVRCYCVHRQATTPTE